ncbi:MAG: tetratricopeptide repeat protein [Chlorobi bacterium]|nr:tetratricopeptide repeat protein [Chlorobiota bacterium]
MKYVISNLFCAVLMIFPLSIIAQSQTDLVKEGINKYQAGDYEAAVNVFSTAINNASSKDDIQTAEVSKETEVSVKHESFVKSSKEKNVKDSREKFVNDSKEKLIGEYINEPLDYLGEDLGKLYFYKGRALMRIGNYEAALSSFDKSIEADPTFVEVYFRRALTNHKLNNEDDVRKDLKKAIELGHQSAEVLFNQLYK